MLDWTKEESYEFTKNLSNLQWAWEFLRRTPEYIQDWQMAPSEQKQYIEHKSEQASWINPHKNPFAVLSPPCPDNVSREEWALTPGVSIDSPLRAYGLKWCLSQEIQDPQTDQPPNFAEPKSVEIVTWECVQDYFEEPHEEADLLIQKPRHLIVAIDLNSPLDSINAEIRCAVETERIFREQTKNSQRKSKLWQLYLRVLDAHNSGATQQAIGDILLTKIHDSEQRKIKINKYLKKSIADITTPSRLAEIANTPG